MFVLFNNKFKSLIKNNVYLFLILNFVFKNLPHFLKKLLLPHEYDYFILKKIKNRKKISILDIGGGYGESIISFYKMSKNIEIDTYEPNLDNYKYCNRLKKIYSTLNVHNAAYGKFKKKKFLFIPKFKNFSFDNFSGFNKFDIQKNFRSIFKIRKIKFSKQIIKFEKSIKKFDLIKIDCETNFYSVIKNVKSNLKKTTILMIENNEDSKKILLFLKRINKNYQCYFFNNSKLIKYNLSNKKLNAQILNLIFIPKNNLTF